MTINEKVQYADTTTEKYKSTGENVLIKVIASEKEGAQYICQTKFRSRTIMHTFRDEDEFRNLDTEIVYIESGVEIADFSTYRPKSGNLIIRATGNNLKAIKFKGDIASCIKLDIPNNNITRLNMSFMPGLEYVDLRDFNIESLITMEGAFKKSGVRHIDFGKYTSYKCKSFAFTFDHCTRLEEIDLSCFDMSNAISMEGMFSCCLNLTNIKCTHGLNTRNVTNMTKMFEKCKELKYIPAIRYLDTSSVTDMSSMFLDCSELRELDLTAFNTRNVTTMAQMFKLCENLYKLDISTLNTGNVTDMSEMFRECKFIQELNVLSFDTHNVTDMRLMFGGCSCLKYLDLSKFDTKQVNTFNCMFLECYALEGINLSNFNTSNCANMNAMFAGCKKLAALDLGSFNTNSCTNMQQMFDHCEKLGTLNLSSFDTSRCTNMSKMFRSCHGLRTLNLSKFNFLAVKSAKNFVDDCPNLVDIGTTVIKISKECQTNGEKFIVPGVNFIVTPGHIRPNENYKPIERLLEGAPVFETVKIIRES